MQVSQDGDYQCCAVLEECGVCAVCCVIAGAAERGVSGQVFVFQDQRQVYVPAARAHTVCTVGHHRSVSQCAVCA